jgi:hypothetical protein
MRKFKLSMKSRVVDVDVASLGTPPGNIIPQMRIKESGIEGSLLGFAKSKMRGNGRLTCDGGRGLKGWRSWCLCSGVRASLNDSSLR